MFRPLTLICFIMALLARPALAADPAQAEKDRAAELVFAGDEKRAAGDHEGALRSYQEADAIMQVPTTGIEVARELAALGRLVEARAQAVKVAQHPAQPSEAAAFARARSNAQGLVKALDERIPTLVVRVTNAAAAEVAIDGRSIALGQPAAVDPGTHIVTARAGTLSATKSIDARKGERSDVELTLQPGPSGGTLSTGTTGDRPVRPLVWVGFGVGTAGLIVGTATGIAAIGKTSDLDKDGCSNRECPARLEGDIDSAVALSHVSTISFGVGIVGGCVGLAALLWPRDRAAAFLGRTRIIAAPSYLGAAGSF